MVLISGVIGSDAYGSNPALGVAIGLMTALAYSGYLLVIRRASPDQRPAGPVAIATVATAACAALRGHRGRHAGSRPDVAGPRPSPRAGLHQPVRRLLADPDVAAAAPGRLTSVILLIQPVTTVVLSGVLLAETPSVAQLVGVALVVGGIAIATVPLGRGCRRTWSSARR